MDRYPSSQTPRPFLRTALLMAALLVPLWAPAPQAAAQDTPLRGEAKVKKVVAHLNQALGGPEAWQSTRYLRFNFFGFRLHHWDRETGRHRLEGQTQDGVSYVVLHDINTREGQVWLDGEQASADAAKEWLERAYGAWINDTYWLLMPYKLTDPGVQLAWDGEEELDGVTYDRLALRFESVGLTPGDRYWAWINRETGLMDRWAYHLQGWEADRPRTEWKWLDWDRYGDVVLSPKRVKVDDGAERSLEELAVFDTLPDSVFESPEPVRVD